MKVLPLLWWMVVLLLGQSTNATAICGGNDFITGFYSSEVTLSGIGNDCSKMEKAGIAHLLEDGMNYYMEQVISGIATSSNKICKEPIVEWDGGKRRTLFQENPQSARRVDNIDPAQPRTRLMKKKIPEIMFIYQGGGRCRLCLPEDVDDRRLLGNIELSSIRAITSRLWNNETKKEKEEEELAALSFRRQLRLSQEEREEIQKNRESIRLAERREESLKKRQGQTQHLFDRLNSVSKKFKSLLQDPPRRNYETRVLDAFAKMLNFMERYISFQLTTLIYSQYVFTQGHCLLLQYPLATVELMYENQWEEPDCGVRE